MKSMHNDEGVIESALSRDGKNELQEAKIVRDEGDEALSRVPVII